MCKKIVLGSAMVSRIMLLLMSSLAVFGIANAEYLVYKKETSGNIIDLSKKEYEKVYEILLEYQWPTSIMFFDGKNEKELREYLRPGKRYEEQLLRKKIKEIDPSYEIAFVPNFMIELFIMENSPLLMFKKKKIKESFEKFGQNILFNHMAKEDGTVQGILNAFKKLYGKRFVFDAHRIINEHFIFYLTHLPFFKWVKNAPLQSIIRAYREVIVNDLLVSLATRGDRLEPLILHPQTYKRILNLEWAAHDNNQALIYRGTGKLKNISHGVKVIRPFELTYLMKDYQKVTPLKDFEMQSLLDLSAKEKEGALDELEIIRLAGLKKRRAKQPACPIALDKPSRSISYGNSLFAGFYYDPDACVYYYAFEPEKIEAIQFTDTLGYALTINKLQYAQGKLTELFRIPPISPVVGLFAQKEFFHPRALSFFSGKPGDGVKMPGFQEGAVYSVDYPGYLVNYTNPLAGAVKLSEYLSKHVQFFKLFEAQGEYTLNPKAIKTLKEDQRALTDKLKDMQKEYTHCVEPKVVVQVLERLVYQLQELARRNEAPLAEA